MKLHIACGTVYLKGYINIDLKLPGHKLVAGNSKLMIHNRTSFNNYYKRKVTRSDFMIGKHHEKNVVCDKFADIRKLPYEENTVDEILGVHIFEHFTFEEGNELLKYWYKLLKPNGFLKLYMPDVLGIIDLYHEDNDMDWCIRQLYGSQKNKFGIHKSGYTKQSLMKKMTDVGFKNVRILANINDYPAFGMTGQK